MNDVGGNPIISPSIVQRLDIHPRFELPLNFAGWSITASGAGRVTFYSNSLDPTTRDVLSRNVTRSYGEFELDVRPPAFARDFRRGGNFFFRHVIEPYVTYRKLSGINNFDRIIRFDYVDAIADTNEIEFGIANRFFTRRSTENVSDVRVNETDRENRPQLSTQPYEALTITLRGKYFFDPFFGGALETNRRNQFYPLNTLSGFVYGGIPRRFSPVNVDARYRPRRDLFVDVRTDIDTNGHGMRALSTTFGLSKQIIQVFQSFYYTRAITLSPDMASLADPRGFEAGTVRGSQWSPAVFLGNRDRGFFGGASFFFDFQKRPGRGDSSLISSTMTLGHSLGLLCGGGTVFELQRGAQKREPGGFQLPLERDRELRDRAVRPALVISRRQDLQHPSALPSRDRAWKGQYHLAVAGGCAAVLRLTSLKAAHPPATARWY